MELLHILLILLITTRAFSELLKRLHFPALLGEIIGGVFLGILFHYFSDQLPVLSHLPENEVFHAITDLSIFFLMLYAGLELQPKEIKNASKGAIWIALGGMIVPLALGMGTGYFIIPETIEQKFALMFFLGVVLAITAVPVAVKLLIDMNRLQTKMGNTIISSAVIDDIISLLLLSILTAIIHEGSIPKASEILLILGKIILFFVITILIGTYLLPKINKVVFKKSVIEEIELSFLIITGFAFSILAELLGMHFVMGAFVAGLFFVRRNIKKEVFNEVEKKVKGITTGFLAPFFFASIGLNMDLSAFEVIPGTIIILILVAITGKLVGTMVPSYLLGFSKRESLAIGFSMNARGVISIIIADVVLKAGLFKGTNNLVVNNLFSAVVLMAIVTTLITPIVLRKVLKKDP